MQLIKLNGGRFDVELNNEGDIEIQLIESTHHGEKTMWSTVTLPKFQVSETNVEVAVARLLVSHNREMVNEIIKRAKDLQN